MRPINEIVIHCSATRRNWMQGATADAKVAEIKRWHTQDNGWSDIGYHYVIDRDGRVIGGRPVAKSGAHTRGRNANTIGLCLIGGHGSSETDRFDEHFTSMQDRALRKLIRSMQSEYGRLGITGHNQYAAKACPGFTVSEWLASAPPVGGAAVAPSSSPLAAIVKAFLTAMKGRKS